MLAKDKSVVVCLRAAYVIVTRARGLEKRDRKCECKAIATVFPCIHESPSTSSVEKYGRNVSCSQRSVFGEGMMYVRV